MKNINVNNSINMAYMGLDANNNNIYIPVNATKENLDLIKSVKDDSFIVTTPEDDNERDMVFYSNNGEELFRINLIHLENE